MSMKKIVTLMIGLIATLTSWAQGFEFQYQGESLPDGATVIIAAEEDLLGDMSCETNNAMDPTNGLMLKLLRGTTASATATLEITYNSLNGAALQWCMGGECTPLRNQTSLTKQFTMEGSRLVQFDAIGINGEGYLTATLKVTIGLESHKVYIVFVNGDYDILKLFYTLTYKVDGEVYKTVSVKYGTAITPEAEPTKEGYTFSGWSEIPTTMPAHDVEVTGSFSVNSYTLTYKIDGEIYKTSTVVYGTALTPEVAPTKEGYTFSGWSEIPTTMPAHDVEVTGSFSINSYNLTYLLNGEEYLSKIVVFGTPLTPEPAVEREGHTFSGWSGLPETMPAHDVIVTGTLTVNRYKLTYMVDGATYKSYEIDYATTITPEPYPVKEGYTFSGWSWIPQNMPAQDVVVNGSFSINSYTLTYLLDGEIYKTYSVVYGTTITPEAFPPAKEGYTFSGWNDVPATMPGHNVTITGQYIINTHTLTYKVNGIIYKTYKLNYHQAITPEADPVSEGYTFSGWSEIPELMPDNDVTVEGSFAINSYTLTYVVDGEVYKTSTVVYGTALTPETAPTKEGYTFSGWDNVPATMPAHDVTVSGSFTINKYKLTYMVDGAVYKSYEIDFASTITPEAAPTKEGHTFSGWSEIPTTMPAHDVTVTGSFSINSYTLIYKVDGEVYKTSTVVYGTALTPEAAPTKEGHTFSGWSEIPATMPAHDVEVTGSFSINSYTLTYLVDGEVYKTSSVVYGTALTLEAEPSREGYTFSGWSELPETMPAHDVTVTGQFIINTHTLTYFVNGAVYKTYKLNYHQAITPEPAPAIEGYTFSGWSEIPELMPDNDVEVTGTLSINSYTITYKVDGEVYKTVSVVYGTTITPEAEPAKEGYTFSGWSEIPTTMPAHDVEVKGTFSINSYTLTYLVDGEVYKTYSVEYGTVLTPETEPTKSGYTFSGWSEMPETMPAEDVTVTGSFIVNLATGIVLDKESLLFNSVEPQQLNVTLAPSDLINKTVNWSSTNPDIATIDETGVVTPLDNGETFIIVSTTDGSDLKDSCKVTVDFKATTLSIDKEEVTIKKLKSQKLTAVVTPDKASQEVAWSSSDASIVTVSETGTIRPKQNGVATITATTTDGTELTATCNVTVNIPSQFEAAVTQTTVTVGTKSGMDEAQNIKLTIDGEVYNGATVTGLVPNRTYHIKATADIGKYNWTEEFDVTTAEIAVNFDCEATPTTLDISASYDAGDATVTRASFSSEEEVNALSLTGLEPGQTYEYTYSITTVEGGTATYQAQFATEALNLKISQTKIVAVGDVVIVANSNIAEEDNVNVGFEWRRYDWPDEIENRSGAAYIYEGTIEGSIKNLNAEKFWKIRPYFQSQAGNRYWGDWVTIDPSDASYFEPSVHTYNTISVTDNTAELKGFVMEGSDDVESRGFMYWIASPQPSPKTGKLQAPSIPGNAVTVEASGNMMVASVDNLEFETEYCYVAFVKTSRNETFYGEEQTFKTGEMDPDGIKDIKYSPLNIEHSAEAWYDLQGHKLDKPQKGINIIRMSDGTTRKVLVK